MAARYQRLTENNCCKFSLISELMKASVNGAVREVTAGSRSKVFLLWNESTLVLVNFPPEVEALLQFTEKKMTKEQVGRRMVTQFKVETASPFSSYMYEGVHVLRTLQGYWKKVMVWAYKRGLDVQFRDLRSPGLLPDPRFDLMGGFRFNQREITETGLGLGFSGIFSACTRYGKSTIIRNIIKAYPDVTTAIIAPGVSLLKQLRDEMREMLPDREVKLIGAGSTVKYPSKDINIVSADSLHKLDAGEMRLMITDEPHALVSQGRILGMDRFELARKYAVGATTGQEGFGGRYDGRDAILEGIFGPVLAKVTYRDAVAMGAVCQIRVAMVTVPVPREAGGREKAFNHFVLKNPKVHRACGQLSKHHIPAEDQALFFIKQEKQADALQAHMGQEVPIVMDKLLTSKEREEITRQVADNERKRIICSDIFVQGVTFHDIRYLVNTSGGGPSTGAIQRPGRLAEIRPDKRFGVMVDFAPVVEKKVKRVGEDTHAKEGDLSGVRAIAREARQRREVYERIGYIVEEVSLDQLGQWIEDNNTHGTPS